MKFLSYFCVGKWFCSRPTARNQSAGFSMLEIIVVLVLIGIIGAFTAPLLGTVLRGTVMGAVEQQTAEEAYWASARMTSLLGMAVNPTLSTPQQISFGQLAADGSTNTMAFAFSNRQITLDSVLFWDQVESFSATYANNLFQVRIKLVDASHPMIALDVFGRNAL